MKAVFSYLHKHWKAVYGATAILFLIAGVFVGRSGSDDSPSFPANGPAEFLYLDRARVIAYLAQYEGGTFNSAHLISKLSDSGSGELTFANLAKVGGSTTRENSLARDITPTAAADYFSLLTNIEDKGELETVSLGRFGTEVRPLPEGEFIRFKTHSLRPPIYLNPYLATRQRTTMQTLFPPAIKARAGISAEQARRQRIRAKYFRRHLGSNPRVVFALEPLEPQEIKAIEEEQEESSTANAETLARAKKAKQKNRCLKERKQRRMRQQTGKMSEAEIEAMHHVYYLMPMNTRLLTKERSLIKFGGGEFTVVAKIVRRFPEPGDRRVPAYIDSPTRETWEQPLAHAPEKLLCSTDLACRKQAQRERAASQKKTAAKAIGHAIRESRCRDLDALRKQTEIPERGAVILPIAIYK